MIMSRPCTVHSLRSTPRASSLSVVVPFLNEESVLCRNLPRMAAEFEGRDVIFVDGGSTDRGPEIASEFGHVIRAPRGRGPQLNAGALHARGDVFLFLHADCWLDRGAMAAVERAATRPGVVGGCLRQAIDDDGCLFRVLEAGANARSRILRIPYGDQAMFVRRSVFERLGRFPDDHLFLEDLAFSRRLRRCGQVVVLPHRVHCSSRHWRRVGILKATVRNWSLAAAYLAGVHPSRLMSLHTL